MAVDSQRDTLITRLIANCLHEIVEVWQVDGAILAHSSPATDKSQPLSDSHGQAWKIGMTLPPLPHAARMSEVPDDRLKMRRHDRCRLLV